MRKFLRLVIVIGAVGFGIALIGLMVSTSQDHALSAHMEGNASATHACTAADFSLSKTKATTEYDVARLTGIITSHCASAVGVQLKWTAFNADGTVAFSTDFWPASTTNIPPRSEYPFEMMDTAPRGRWTYRVEPINVTVW